MKVTYAQLVEDISISAQLWVGPFDKNASEAWQASESRGSEHQKTPHDEAEDPPEMLEQESGLGEKRGCERVGKREKPFAPWDSQTRCAVEQVAREQPMGDKFQSEERVWEVKNERCSQKDELLLLGGGGGAAGGQEDGELQPEDEGCR